MCGPENTNRPRGGALAVLGPFPSPRGPQLFNADLAFHTPGSPESSGATHARLTPANENSCAPLSNLHVFIHSTGDLRSSIADCGLFRQFAISMASSNAHDDYVELSLDAPLSLQVGNDGIIGRRVSLCSGPIPTLENTIAQGIVGFNFSSPAQSSL